MKVLVGCEFSGVVRRAFRERGHDAWSCDLIKSEDDSPHHYQCSVLEVIKDIPFDLCIFHPPCTDLCVSGARYFEQKRKDGRQQRSMDFFMKLASAPQDAICIENPVGIMSTVYRKPDVIIQPWQYGHPESKATCLWLKGLPKLQPTNILVKPECGHWDNQCPGGQNKLGPSSTRAADRARTYSGIANAMAATWSLDETEF